MFTSSKEISNSQGGRSSPAVDKSHHGTHYLVSSGAPTVHEISEFDRKWNPYLEKGTQPSWLNGKFIGSYQSRPRKPNLNHPNDEYRTYAEVTKPKFKFNPNSKEFIPKHFTPTQSEYISAIENEFKAIDKKLKLIGKIADKLSADVDEISEKDTTKKTAVKPQTFRFKKSANTTSVKPESVNSVEHPTGEFGENNWIYGVDNKVLINWIETPGSNHQLEKKISTISGKQQQSSTLLEKAVRSLIDKHDRDLKILRRKRVNSIISNSSERNKCKSFKRRFEKKSKPRTQAKHKINNISNYFFNKRKNNNNNFEAHDRLYGDIASNLKKKSDKNFNSIMAEREIKVKHLNVINEISNKFNQKINSKNTLDDCTRIKNNRYITKYVKLVTIISISVLAILFNGIYSIDKSNILLAGTLVLMFSSNLFNDIFNIKFKKNSIYRNEKY
jgi:hypothetical protein